MLPSKPWYHSLLLICCQVGGDAVVSKFGYLIYRSVLQSSILACLLFTPGWGQLLLPLPLPTTFKKSNGNSFSERQARETERTGREPFSKWMINTFSFYWKTLALFQSDLCESVEGGGLFTRGEERKFCPEWK